MTEIAETGSIAKALAAFQAKMPTVAKGKTAKVGQYSYTYAGLADVVEAAMPLLTEQGLAFSCTPEITERGAILTGILLHTSGESIRGSLAITGSRPQEVGSSITYARRYLFGCMTGLVTDDDDDGALASGRGQAKKAQRSKSTPPDDPWYDAPVRQPGDRQVSGDQLKKIGAAMSELGMTDRSLALAYVKDVIGREIESRNDLTRSEAHKVIDALERDKQPTEEQS